MKSVVFLFSVFFLLGCKPSLPDILLTDKDLASFIAKNPDYVIEEMKRVTNNELHELQQQHNPYGEWYQKIPTGNYQQVSIKNKEGNGFLVLINEQNKVERILGLISVKVP